MDGQGLFRTGRCPVCGGEEVGFVLDVESVPVLCNALSETRAEAEAATVGRVALVHCLTCDHLFNRAFDPALLAYSSAYENSLHYSETFNSYSRGLVEELIDRFDLHEKQVVEVGCGAGDFLKKLCASGENRGFGFDRSFPGSSTENEDGGRVKFVPEFLTPDTPRFEVDFLLARHVLEHLADPLAVLRGLREWIGPEQDCGFYFEVPNARWTVDRGGIWDVIYEHPSLFTLDSLLHLVRKAGYEPETWGEAFGGQYLQVMGRTNGSGETGSRPPSRSTVRGTLSNMGSEGSVHGLRFRFEKAVGDWDRWVKKQRGDGRPVALWGAGSKGVTFLNLLDPGPGVRFVVDVNPRKQGRFVPVTGHEVLPPKSLVADRPDIILVANPLYESEIQAHLAEMGVHARTVAIGEELP